MDLRDLSGPRAVDGVPDIASHPRPPLGRCGCGVDVHAASFRDRLSLPGVVDPPRLPGLSGPVLFGARP